MHKVVTNIYYFMMRSFLYSCHLFSFTAIVASLSLGNLDQLGPESDGDAAQFMRYVPTGGTEDPSSGDSALGLDTLIPGGWAAEVAGTTTTTTTEQVQPANNKVASCSSPNKKRRRGEGNYCSPPAAPPPSLQFRPDSHQVGSGPGGSTTTTSTDRQQDSSSQLGLDLLGNERFDKLQFAPWSSAQSACPENRPVAVCAGADMQPWELGDQGWRQIPFSSPLPSPVELLYWPYCRLCKLHLYT